MMIEWALILLQKNTWRMRKGLDGMASVRSRSKVTSKIKKTEVQNLPTFYERAALYFLFIKNRQKCFGFVHSFAILFA